MDLSLEFPDRYHTAGAALRACRDSCTLEGKINLPHFATSATFREQQY